MLLVLSFNVKTKKDGKITEKELGFNPYCYWSYLLTVHSSNNNNGINLYGGFNPYCYWSYLLTVIRATMEKNEGKVSILIVTGPIF